MNVLESIGGTPLVQLRKIVPPGSARVVVKLGGGNPTGNMKDRIDDVGGELTIRSVAGRGVEVAAVVPTARLAEVV